MESGDWIRPIEKRSLSKVVMDSVRDGIISGEVKQLLVADGQAAIVQRSYQLKMDVQVD